MVRIAMNRTGFATVALLLALAGTLWARAEFHLGSIPENQQSENTWQRFVTSDDRLIVENGAVVKITRESDPEFFPEEIGNGIYVVVDEEGGVLGTGTVEAFEENGGGSFLPEYNYRGPDRPSMEDDVLRALWIDPNVNLALFENLTALGGNMYHGHNTGQYPDTFMRWTIDGDPTTSRLVLFKWNPLEQDPTVTEQFLGSYASALILNFGIELPINRVRIFPRLGRTDDADAIAAMAEPTKPDTLCDLEDPAWCEGALECDSDGCRPVWGESSFAGNYLEWYEIAVADNAAPFLEVAGGAREYRPGQGQWRRFSENTGYVDSMDTDPNLTALIQTRENLDPVIDFRFPTSYERFVSIRPYLPERTWEMAEFEVYGEGYVRRSVYRSEILDFGTPVAWSKIRWAGEQPPRTQIEIRTRTGNCPQEVPDCTSASPDLFLERVVSGQLLPIDYSDWAKDFNKGGTSADDLSRTVDLDNWSFWSPTYDFTAGERDPSLPAAAWVDGTPVLSPSPTRYLQLEVTLLATLEQTPRLDGLSLFFSESPAAEQVIAEIWPIEVDSFEPHPFTYVVKPILREGNRGFNRLDIFTNGPAEEVSLVVVGGDTLVYPDRVIDESLRPEILSDRIVISFDPLDDPRQDNEKRIEVQFSARVLRFGSEFSGWVYDSSEPDLKQSINPGNATIRFVGDVLSVRTPTGGDLLQRLDIQPRAFTPNGDQINDEAAISFDLRDLTTARPVSVQIWTLDGRAVRRTLPPCGTGGQSAVRASGHFIHCWDGQDEAGVLAPPGLYLVQVELDSDEGLKKAIGTLSVAY